MYSFISVNCRSTEDVTIFSRRLQDIRVLSGRGDWQPVFRLRKSKLENISQEEPQHWVQESSSSSQADDARTNVLHAVLEDVLLESSQENQLMGHLKDASKWCLEQSNVLLGSVQLPKLLCMKYLSTTVSKYSSMKMLLMHWTNYRRLNFQRTDMLRWNPSASSLQR